MNQVCPYCDHNILKTNFITHEVRCSRDLKACPHCDVLVHSSKLNEHKGKNHSFLELCLDCNDYVNRSEHNCPKALVPCDYCFSYISNDEKSKHENECSRALIICTKCGVKMTRFLHLSHSKLEDCTKTVQQETEGINLFDVKKIFGKDFSQLKGGTLSTKSKNNKNYLKNLLDIISVKSGTNVTDLIESEFVKKLLIIYGEIPLDQILVMPEFKEFALNRKAQLVWRYLGSAKNELIQLLHLFPDANRSASRIMNDFNTLDKTIRIIIDRNNASENNQVLNSRKEFLEVEKKIIYDNQVLNNSRVEGKKYKVEFEEALKKIELGPNPLKKKYMKKNDVSDIDEFGIKEIKIGKNPMKRHRSNQRAVDEDDLTALKFIKIGKNPIKKLKK